MEVIIIFTYILNVFFTLIVSLFLGTTVLGEPNRVKAAEAEDETYIIGMDQTMAPFTFLDDDREPAGLELEIFEAIRRN